MLYVLLVRPQGRNFAHHGSSEALDLLVAADRPLAVEAAIFERRAGFRDQRAQRVRRETVAQVPLHARAGGREQGALMRRDEGRAGGGGHAPFREAPDAVPLDAAREGPYEGAA